MDILIPLGPVLGCLAVGVMMWWMMRGQHHAPRQTTDPHTREEFERLRAEVAS